MREMIGKTLDLLTPREKKIGLLVLVMVVVMALIETAGVASVMPFLAVLGNPEVVHTNPYLATVYELAGVKSTEAFLIALGMASFLIVVVGAVFRLATHYALYRWANMRRHSVSHRLLSGYLRQPYEFFLNRNTADLSKSILSEVDELTENVFQPGIQLIAYATSGFVLVVFLVLIDPWIALIVAAVVGGGYLAVYLGVRGILGRLGRDRANANRERFTAASEVLGGIKDIKVLGREDVYLSRFTEPSRRFSRRRASNAVLALAPKHLIEAVGFGGILALAILLMISRTDLAATLPFLGLYAFAGYRLLPSAQQVFASLARLRFGQAAVEAVHEDLRNVACVTGDRRSGANGSDLRLDLKDCLELRGVSYMYPGATEPALFQVDLTIRRQTSLGIIGQTGSGKTTLVDVLLGLLPPCEGEIIVDGRILDPSNIRHWQRSVGYVPQRIYLTDASILENIAFGVEPVSIDRERLEAVAEVAHVHDFVRRLPLGYDTPVGERGVRLSGGQRQRLGLARALYHHPSVLILDEATSALDVQTERSVMAEIAAMRNAKTIVLITHRLGSIETCDQVVVLNDGMISESKRHGAHPIG